MNSIQFFVEGMPSRLHGECLVARGPREGDAFCITGCGMIAGMDKLKGILTSAATWSVGVLLPAFLVISGRRALAVAVLAAFAVVLLVGWRWRAFLWWAIAGITGGAALGLFAGWLFVLAGRSEMGDQATVIFLLAIPVGIGVGIILAGAAFYRRDPRFR